MACTLTGIRLSIIPAHKIILLPDVKHRYSFVTFKMINKVKVL